jgi:hypothetical protein
MRRPRLRDRNCSWRMRSPNCSIVTGPRCGEHAELRDRGIEFVARMLIGYLHGRYRGDYCNGFYTQYRAARRTVGKDDPRAPRSVDTNGHYRVAGCGSPYEYPPPRPPPVSRSRSDRTTCATPTYRGC